MASEVSICNRALQKLGANRITSLTDASPNARACNNAYAEVRDAELRAHPWAFSIKRATLASSTTPPAFKYGNAIPLPTDCLRLLPPDDYDNDWVVESGNILTNATTANVRYISQVVDPNLMDPTFREALACRLAMEMCEELTQSNTKLQGIMEQYKMALREARRNNAFERRSQEPREDSWITVRR